HVSFTVHRGEIVGIAGAEGNGQGELVRALIGLENSRRPTSHTGDDVAKLSPQERRAAGSGYISEDRQNDGLVLAFSLWENAALGHQRVKPYGKGLWIARAGARRRTEQIIDSVDVRTPGPDVPIFTLPGGNQQKL